MQDAPDPGQHDRHRADLAQAEQRLEEARAKAVAPDLEGLNAKLASEQARLAKAQEADVALNDEVAKAQAHLDNARGRPGRVRAG